ncbi:hypothetical protein ARMSODRAFT_974670 [Armillaria solidipes]|uniref:Uncharacterized protein n=1 Tax=Armillaria solidipes TaxID=1076256 RepID=A0A2H3BKJ4_9AGAR|nr:hypothetical protein ARMSODRAFT_974670 [Armillaria solidipes]
MSGDDNAYIPQFSPENLGNSSGIRAGGNTCDVIAVACAGDKQGVSGESTALLSVTASSQGKTTTTIGFPGIETGGGALMLVARWLGGLGWGGNGDWGVIIAVGGDGDVGGRYMLRNCVPPCRKWGMHRAGGHWWTGPGSYAVGRRLLSSFPSLSSYSQWTLGPSYGGWVLATPGVGSIVIAAGNNFRGACPWMGEGILSCIRAYAQVKYYLLCVGMGHKTEKERKK